MEHADEIRTLLGLIERYENKLEERGIKLPPDSKRVAELTNEPLNYISEKPLNMLELEYINITARAVLKLHARLVKKLDPDIIHLFI